MTTPREVRRYLRQVAEIGGPDLFLEGLDRDAAAVLAAGQTPDRKAAGKSGSRGTRQEAARRTGRGVASTAATPASDRTPPMSVPATAVRPVARTASPETVAELDRLAAAAAACVECRLHETRSQAVFGEGNPAADLVVVGEAPGQEEDRTGRPFVGRAGRLLDLLLMAAGFPRQDVYICNVLKCRPPGNRNPQADEMDVCTRNFLHRQLELIQPRMLLAVGRFAVNALLESTTAIGRLRGRLHAYRGVPLVVSYHPAYLLRSPNMIRTAWSDYQLIRKVLDDPV